MNPLARYFLDVMRAEPTCSTPRYVAHEQALEEMGYWSLTRPAWTAREDMPPCAISLECEFVEAFLSYTSALDLGDGVVAEGYATAVDVYREVGAEPHRRVYLKGVLV